MALTNDVADWSYAESGIEVDATFGEVHADAWRRLGQCGTWWTGAQRVAILAEVRTAAGCDLCAERVAAVSPNAVQGGHGRAPGGDVLPEDAIEAAHRIATDPGRLTRSWVESMCDSLGEEAYVELAAVVATRYAIDGFAASLGVDPRPLPQPGEGTPDRVRPEGVGNVGAFVSQSTDKALANVSRAASLVPDTADIWRGVVNQQYSRGPDFMELVWDRALERPQVELVAATVSKLNECFY
ncbi:MAG: alkylhydroperoxidase-related (seleno)protein [Actinomycetota bacterium]|nr:alkylhydroperoxidase-related (seleno)protein [Actinomycetota bacterium]